MLGALAKTKKGEMKILAGTSKGLFEIVNGSANLVLNAKGVREIVRLERDIFAGTSQGLFVSSDLGVHWSGPDMADYTVWQVRRAIDGTLYAGTYPAELFKSTDAGENWEKLDSFARVVEEQGWCIPVEPTMASQARAIVTDADNPDVLWVGVEVGGIMYSDDAGASWRFNTPGGNPDLHMMFPHPSRRGVLFASTGYGRLDGIAAMVEGNAGVFRSEDFGESWDYMWKGVTPRYSRPMCIDPRHPFSLTVASAPTAFSSFKDQGGAQAMLFRSDNEGHSWTSLCDKSHSPSVANFHGLTVNPDEIGGVLVGTDTGELWSVSKEATWTLLAEGMPAVLSIFASGDAQN